MQNFGVTNKEHYGMLWYFWSGQFVFVQIVDTEIAVKIISKLFNMFLCTAQLNLTHL